MSIVKSEDSGKWINGFMIICGVIIVYVMIAFLGQLSEWFDLEAKIPNFEIVSQFVGIGIGVLSFVLVKKNKQATEHLNEVFSELVKVVWPDKDSIMKMTVGLVVALSIVSGFFVVVDYGFQKLLELFY